MEQAPIDKTSALHYTWGDQCDSWILHDTETLSVKQESMPPGSKEKLHIHHQASQFFFILKGRAVFYLDGEKIILSAQQGLSVPNGSRHFIANESAGDIEFLVITQPSAKNDREDLE